MLTSAQVDRDLLDTAADLAAIAALLEIADELGIFGHLEGGLSVTAEELADAAGTPVSHMEIFLSALAAAGLVIPDSPAQSVRVTDAFPKLRTAAGYLCWALKANRPFIENSLAFFKDHDAASRLHTRDSRDVAVTSRWVGSGISTRRIWPAWSTHGHLTWWTSALAPLGC